MHKYSKREKYNCVSELIDYGFKILRKLLIKHVFDHLQFLSIKKKISEMQCNC